MSRVSKSDKRTTTIIEGIYLPGQMRSGILLKYMKKAAPLIKYMPNTRGISKFTIGFSIPPMAITQCKVGITP